MYFHGSPKIIKGDYLNPRPSNVVDGEKKVFATNNKGMALIFLAEWSDKDIWLGSHKNKLYAIELIPDIFKETFDKKTGYIYYVSKDNFYSDKRLGMPDYEFISDRRIKIIKKQRIKNVLNHLKRDKSINLIYYKNWINCITR